MAKVAYHNDTETVKHVGNKMIRPGETREVEETLLPDYKAKKPTEPEANPNAELLALLDLSIPKITDKLPGLDGDELDIIEAAEQNGKTRAGLLEAIAEERLRRAAEVKTEKDLIDFKISLASMEEDELLQQVDLYAEDESRLALVQAEIDLRAEQNAGGNE